MDQGKTKTLTYSLTPFEYQIELVSGVKVVQILALEKIEEESSDMFQDVLLKLRIKANFKKVVVVMRQKGDTMG